jgi:hypothetical protein
MYVKTLTKQNYQKILLKVALAGERTRDLLISFIFSSLYRWATGAPQNYQNLVVKKSNFDKL